jgi:hypothetical protein
MDSESVSRLKCLGTMVDHENNVTTGFYLEPPGTPGPRCNSKIKHLLAISSDGRPINAIAVSDGWSEADILMLIKSTLLLAIAPEIEFTEG